MKRTKRNILIELTGRYLTADEADHVRALATSFKPRVHLVLPSWRYLEIRSVNENAAAKVIEALGALPGVRFREL
ncbi:MAG: hypothetical protein L0226_13730 [Acidobacteria bacterium]|nr:hypothetical protein [Acidobacteriota bacterium]